MIEAKVAGDMKLAGVAFRRDATLRAEDAASLIDGRCRQIHQGLRTIGLLPSVQRIERHGEPVEGDAAHTIQQLYNSLKLNSQTSPKFMSFRSTSIQNEIDPATGAAEEPILEVRPAGCTMATESEGDAGEAGAS